MRALWRRAGELGLVIETHFRPPVAAQVRGAVSQYPEFPVLLDHLARPREGDAVEYADVLDLARFPQVYMKLSGLDMLGGTPPLYLESRIFTRQIADAFGADRLVWGGGSPAMVDAHLEHLPQSDRDKVKGGNLARLLDFFPPVGTSGAR